MKITYLSERVQAFYEKWTEEDDGDFTKNLEPAGWFWAKITPISPPSNVPEDKAKAQRNRYEITMHKEHICNTRHACLRQLRWKHKLLEIYTQWLEIKGFPCVKCLAKECIEEEHDG